MIAARKGRAVRHAWDGAWARVKKGQVAVAIDPIWVLAQMTGEEQGVSGRPSTAISARLPRCSTRRRATPSGSTWTTGSASTSWGPAPRTTGPSKSAKRSRPGMMTLAKNALPGLKQQVMAQPASTREVSAGGSSAWPRRCWRVHGPRSRGGTIVRLHADSDGDVASVAQTYVPIATAAPSTARRVQSQNNLRQLLLAMHNSADTYGHLPPAVIRPADGKPPYSWRVAILPFIEGNDLFKEYNFNEPWDSVSNRKLIEKMPPVYRHPSDESGNTAYFVVTGEPTLFPPGSPGVKFAEVTDGTLNTIMFVEAKREIPWTKPEDIEYDPAKPMPEFGGFTNEGCNAGFADGVGPFHLVSDRSSSAEGVPESDGGEVVRLNDILPNPIPATLDPPTPPPTATPPRR